MFFFCGVLRAEEEEDGDFGFGSAFLEDLSFFSLGGLCEKKRLREKERKRERKGGRKRRVREKERERKREMGGEREREREGDLEDSGFEFKSTMFVELSVRHR